MFAVGTFAIGVALQELWRGMRARQAMTSDNPALALTGLVRRNRRRYGGYLVHIGISVLFIGVAASSAFNGERDIRLAPGAVHDRQGLHVHVREADRRRSSSAPASSSGSRSARASA